MSISPLAVTSLPLPLAFGIPSGQDLIILLLIILVLFGAKKLPELARGLGQSVNEFKKAKDEFDREVAKTSSAGTPASPPTPSATAAVTVEPASTVATQAKNDQKQS